MGVVTCQVSKEVPYEFHGLYCVVASYTTVQALMQSQVGTCVSLGLAFFGLILCNNYQEFYDVSYYWL